MLKGSLVGLVVKKKNAMCSEDIEKNWSSTYTDGDSPPKFRESTSLQPNTQTHLFGIANFVTDAIAESSHSVDSSHLYLQSLFTSQCFKCGFCLISWALVVLEVPPVAFVIFFSSKKKKQNHLNFKRASLRYTKHNTFVTCRLK